MEIIKSGTERKNVEPKRLFGNHRQINICTVGMPEGEEKEKKDRIFEKIMA